MTVSFQNSVDAAKPLLRKAIQISQQTPYWHCRLLFQLAVSTLGPGQDMGAEIGAHPPSEHTGLPQAAAPRQWGDRDGLLACSQVSFSLTSVVSPAQVFHSASRVIAFPSLLVLPFACIHLNFGSISCQKPIMFFKSCAEIPRVCLLGNECLFELSLCRAAGAQPHLGSMWSSLPPLPPQPPFSSPDIVVAWSQYSEMLR